MADGYWAWEVPDSRLPAVLAVLEAVSGGNVGTHPLDEAVIKPEPAEFRLCRENLNPGAPL